MDRKKLQIRLASLIFFIFIANFLANKFYWYYTIWLFDMPMHFLGGFWLGLLFLYSYSIKEATLRTFFNLLFFIFFIGVGWEVFEAIVNKTTLRDSFNYLDTTSDILFDLSGGMCAIFYYFKRIMFNKKNEINKKAEL